MGLRRTKTQRAAAAAAAQTVDVSQLNDSSASVVEPPKSRRGRKPKKVVDVIDLTSGGAPDGTSLNPPVNATPDRADGQSSLNHSASLANPLPAVPSHDVREQLARLEDEEMEAMSAADRARGDVFRSSKQYQDDCKDLDELAEEYVTKLGELDDYRGTHNLLVATYRQAQAKLTAISQSCIRQRALSRNLLSDADALMDNAEELLPEVVVGSDSLALKPFVPKYRFVLASEDGDGDKPPAVVAKAESGSTRVKRRREMSQGDSDGDFEVRSAVERFEDGNPDVWRSSWVSYYPTWRRSKPNLSGLLACPLVNGYLKDLGTYRRLRGDRKATKNNIDQAIIGRYPGGSGDGNNTRTRKSVVLWLQTSSFPDDVFSCHPYASQFQNDYLNPGGLGA